MSDEDVPTFSQYVSVQELRAAVSRVGRVFQNAPHAGRLWRAYPFSSSLDELPALVHAWAEDLMRQIRDYEEGPCIECNGRGWDLFEVSETRPAEIQRCDACRRFSDDYEAAQMALRVIPEALALYEGEHPSACAKKRGAK